MARALKEEGGDQKSGKQQRRTRKLTSAPHPKFLGVGEGAAEPQLGKCL